MFLSKLNLLKRSTPLAKKMLPFDTYKASLDGYYKPMPLNDLIQEKQAQDALILNTDKSLFDQSSWSYSRREHIEYDGIPYNWRVFRYLK